MSDGLPSDEQLRRIERGVQQRIRGRRIAVQRIAGTFVALLLLVGGVALVRPLVSSSGSAASAGGSAGGGSSALVAVVCHGPAGVRIVRASPADLPASAIAACSAVPAKGAASARPNALDGRTATSAPARTPVLCRTPSGTLHVYPGGARTCAEHAMTRVRG
jgi:hypothetical protein